jgi:uncharacterized cupredoxin-like copper-binding protein
MTKTRIVLLLSVAVALLLWAVPATAGTRATVVTVTAGKPSEFRFTLSRSSVPHGTVTFKIKNAGTVPHNFKIGGKTSPMVSPGATRTITVKLKAGKAPYLCTLPGHAAAGMKGVLTVK